MCAIVANHLQDVRRMRVLRFASPAGKQHQAHVPVVDLRCSSKASEWLPAACV